MGEILRQLAHLVVQSIPTVIFVFLLLAILERLFFKPLTRILEERDNATLGALALAREKAATAEAKARQYEASFEAARQEVYRLQEANRRTALSEREERLQKARQESAALVQAALADLRAQALAAQEELTRASQLLAYDITESVLGNGTRPGQERRT